MVCGMQDCGDCGGLWGVGWGQGPPNQIKIENPYQTKPNKAKTVLNETQLKQIDQTKLDQNQSN